MRPWKGTCWFLVRVNSRRMFWKKDTITLMLVAIVDGIASCSRIPVPNPLSGI